MKLTNATEPWRMLAGAIVQANINAVVKWKALEIKYPLVDGKVPDSYTGRSKDPQRQRKIYFQIAKDGLEAEAFFKDADQLAVYTSLDGRQILALANRYARERAALI